MTAPATARPIPGFPDYLAISDGRVISTKWGSERVLRASGVPYLRVSLCVGSKIYGRTVHGLIALAFLGPRPDGMNARHLDGNSWNNAVSNLAWGTQSENIRDSVNQGTHAEARKTHCPRKHPYAGDNLKVTPAGTRVCLTCKRAREKAARQARRALARAL
jgi:hypothetical protein